MAITRYAGDRFTIAAGETKPTGVLDGGYLIDTGNLTQFVRRTVGGTSQWTQLAGGGGGGGSPGGSNTQVQFNNNGAFGASTGLTFDGQRLYANNLQLSGILYDSNASDGENGMVLTNEGQTGVNWKSIESVLSGVGGSGVANYVARWSDEDTLTSGTIYDNGDVGIGTANPDAKLHVLDTVAGDVVILETTHPSSSNGPDIVFYRNSSSPADADELGRLAFRGKNDANQDINYTNIIAEAIDVSDGTEDGALKFYTYLTGASTETMVLRSANVGIGTASPSSLLHVYGADPVLTIQDSESTVANASAIFRIGESDGSANLNNNFNIKFVGTASGGDLDISRYNSTTLANQGIRIKHDGNVGIGTITPTSLLHVFSASSSQTYSTGADELIVEGSDHAGISILAPAAKRAQLYFNTDAFFRWVDSDGVFTIDTSSSSSKIAIAPGGAKVGIGTNAPDVNLHIYSASSPQFRIQDSTNNCILKAYAQDSDAFVGTHSNHSFIIGMSNTTKITVASALTTMVGEVLITTGSTSVRTLSGVLKADTIENNSGASNLKLQTESGGNKHIEITPDGTGNVGIGIATPAAKLNVVLDSSATNTPTDVLRLGHTSTGSTAVGFGALIRFDGERTGSTVDGMGRLGFVADVMTASRVDGAFIVQTGADGTYTERMRITSAGSVGIGTNSPSYKFHVTGGIIAAEDGAGTLRMIGTALSAKIIDLKCDNAVFKIRSVNDGREMYHAADAYHKWYISGSEKMQINSTGLVGIGTNNPVYTLQGNGTNGGIIGVTRTSGNTTGTLGHVRFGNTDIDSDLANIKGVQDGATDSARLEFETQATGGAASTRMEINSAGAIQFNTYGSGTHTGTSAYKLSVDSSGNIIETSIGAGAVDGSGTTNTIARWTDSDTIGDSLITVPSNTSVKINASGADAVRSLRIDGTNGSSEIAGFILENDGANAKVNLKYNIGNGTPATKVTLNHLGYVGINTTAPAIYLHNHGSALIGRTSGTTGGYVLSSYDLILSNGNSGTVILLYNSAGAFQSSLIKYDANCLKLGLNSSNSTNAISTATAVNVGSVGVGIGTVTPGGLLEVYAASGAVLSHVKSGTVISRLTANSTSSDGTVGTSSAHDFLIQRAGSTRITLSGSSVVVNDSGEDIDFRVEGDTDTNLIRTDAANERVGIGTNAPSSKLHVNSEISCGADDNNRAMFGYTPSRFYLGTRQSGTNYLNTVSVTSGKVGIGTDAPAALLNLFKTGANDAVSSAIYLQRAAGNYGAAILQVGNGSSGSEKLMFTAGHNSDPMSISNAKMTIQHDGNVGIGTTTPAGRLQVIQAASDQSGAAALKVVGTAYGTNKAIHSYMDTSNATKSLLYVENSSGVVLNITGDGSTNVNGNINFETMGQYLTFYGGGETEHSISSRNSSGNAADDLRINTFGALFINLDSNNNNTSGADFSIGRHGQTGAITDWLLDLSGETGKLTLSKYGSGTHTGTLAKSLGVDSSGNVIEFTGGGGTVDGSGTANYVAKWSGSGTIANSVLRDDGNRLAVGAAPSSAAGILHLKDVSSNQAKMTLESANAYNSWINFSAASDEMSIGYDKSTVGGFVFANADALNSNIRMVILSAGSVGIGTVSPSTKFQVHNGDILITSGKQLISTNSYTQAPPAMLTTQGPSTGATSLGTGTWGIMLGPQHTRSSVANTYYPGIAFNHLLNNGGVVTYNNHPQAWIGTRLHDTPGSERAFLVFSTKAGTGVAASDVPLERMCIDPVNGSVGIGTTDPAAELQIGRPQTTSAFTDSFIKLRPSSTTNSTGLTSITFGTSTVDNYGYSISGWRAGTDGAPYFAIKYHNNSAAGVDVMVMDRYGKVGIGTNAPDSKLEIAGGGYNSSLKIKGGASHTGIQFEDSDGNTDGYVYAISDTIGFLDAGADWTIQSKNDDYIRFSTNGNTEHMRIKSDGKVGIGTDAPGSLLTVSGNSDDGDAACTIAINDEDSTVGSKLPAIQFYGGGTTQGRIRGGDAAFQIAVGSSPTTALNINTANGYPSFTYGSQVRLTLGSAGTAETNTANWIRGTGANLEFNAASGDFNWEVGGVHRMRLTDTGFLGIGLGAGTDPFGQLHVNGTNGSNIHITRTSGGTTSTFGSIIFGNTNIDSSCAEITGDQDGTNDSGRLEFGTQASVVGGVVTRLTIKGDGNVGIGTDAPAQLLHVNGGSDANLRLTSASNRSGVFIDKPGTSTIMGSALVLSSDETYRLGTASYYHVVMQQGGTVSLNYQGNTKLNTTSGGVTVTGTLTETSSITLKENVETYTPSLDIINKIRPVKYNRKTNKDKKEIGLIAEELAELFPELVEKDEKGNPSSVNYSRAVTVLLGGFKELYKEIEELKKRI